MNLKIRLTREEMEHLKKRAEEDGGYSFRNGRTNYSGFYRARLLAATNYKNDELKKLQKQLAYEVRKIGVNINQVTKKINSGYGMEADARYLQESLENVEKSLKENMEACEKLWESQN